MYFDSLKLKVYNFYKIKKIAGGNFFVWDGFGNTLLYLAKLGINCDVSGG